MLLMYLYILNLNKLLILLKIEQLYYYFPVDYKKSIQNIVPIQ